MEPLPDGYRYYRARFRTWALRSYALIFTTFGLLAVARAVRHHHELSLVVRVLALVVGGTAIGIGVYAYSCAVRYRRISRRAGGRYWRP
jgi:hypothetical protein